MNQSQPNDPTIWFEASTFCNNMVMWQNKIVNPKLSFSITFVARIQYKITLELMSPKISINYFLNPLRQQDFRNYWLKTKLEHDHSVSFATYSVSTHSLVIIQWLHCGWQWRQPIGW